MRYGLGIDVIDGRSHLPTSNLQAFQPPSSRDLPLVHLIWSTMRLVGTYVPTMYYDIECLWETPKVGCYDASAIIERFGYFQYMKVA
jgi:hypothetical protein